MEFEEKKTELFDLLNTEEKERKFFGVHTNTTLEKKVNEDETNLSALQSQILGAFKIKDTFVTKPSCAKKLLIKHNSKWKAIFDFIVLLLLAYSCMSILYFATFEHISKSILHYPLEGVFFLSIVLKFFQKYQDEQTLEIVDSYGKIARKHLKSWFLIEIIAIFPYELFEPKIISLKLIRLIRLPKLSSILRMKNFDRLLDYLFSGSKSEKLSLLFTLRFAFKIFRVILILVVLTYFVGCFWYFVCWATMKEGKKNFITLNGLDEMEAYDKFIISCYFALTTLSTVGYGDFYAVTESERILAIFIFLLGVAMFSFVMESFSDLIKSQDKRKRQNVADLQNWVNNLRKFSNKKQLDIDLIKKIDQHFKYFWQHDRNEGVHKTDPYIHCLPIEIKQKLMEYKWSDVFKTFSNFFLYFDSNKDKYRKFYYDVSFKLLPRRFAPLDLIYIPEEEIEEMYLIIKGNVNIGRITNEQIEYKKSFYKREWFGDFYVLFNTRSKYYYCAGSEMETFGINKKDFVDILQKHSELLGKFRRRAYRRYKDTIRLILDHEDNNGNDLNGQLIVDERGEDFIVGKQSLRLETQVKTLKNQVEVSYVKIEDDFCGMTNYLHRLSSYCDNELGDLQKRIAEFKDRTLN